MTGDLRATGRTREGMAARKYLSGRKLGLFLGRWSLGARSAHLWYFGFSREEGCGRRLCMGAVIPWAGALPYRYITSPVLGAGGWFGRSRGEKLSAISHEVWFFLAPLAKCPCPCRGIRRARPARFE